MNTTSDIRYKAARLEAKLYFVVGFHCVGYPLDELFEIVDKLIEIEKEKNLTVSQLAIAWTIDKGALPIPGTKRVKYLEENVAAINSELTEEELARLEEVSPENAVHGGHY